MVLQHSVLTQQPAKRDGMKSVASKSSNWTSSLLRKELFNGAFELLFLPKAFLYGPDLPGPVYEECHRKKVSHAVALRYLAVAEHNRIRDFQFCQGRLDLLPSTVIERNAENREAPNLILLRKLFKPWHLDPAWRAPGRPEVHRITPAVLIGLGALIMYEAGSFDLLI
jgi:hypothetical protein